MADTTIADDNDLLSSPGATAAAADNAPPQLRTTAPTIRPPDNSPAPAAPAEPPPPPGVTAGAPVAQQAPQAAPAQQAEPAPPPGVTAGAPVATAQPAQASSEPAPPPGVTAGAPISQTTPTSAKPDSTEPPPPAGVTAGAPVNTPKPTPAPAQAADMFVPTKLTEAVRATDTEGNYKDMTDAQLEAAELKVHGDALKDVAAMPATDKTVFDSLDKQFKANPKLAPQIFQYLVDRASKGDIAPGQLPIQLNGDIQRYMQQHLFQGVADTFEGQPIRPDDPNYYQKEAWRLAHDAATVGGAAGSAIKGFVGDLGDSIAHIMTSAGINPEADLSPDRDAIEKKSTAELSRGADVGFQNAIQEARSWAELGYDKTSGPISDADALKRLMAHGENAANADSAAEGRGYLGSAYSDPNALKKEGIFVDPKEVNAIADITDPTQLALMIGTDGISRVVTKAGKILMASKTAAKASEYLTAAKAGLASTRENLATAVGNKPWLTKPISATVAGPILKTTGKAINATVGGLTKAATNPLLAAPVAGLAGGVYDAANALYQDPAHDPAHAIEKGISGGLTDAKDAFLYSTAARLLGKDGVSKPGWITKAGHVGDSVLNKGYELTGEATRGTQAELNLNPPGALSRMVSATGTALGQIVKGASKGAIQGALVTPAFMLPQLANDQDEDSVMKTLGQGAGIGALVGASEPVRRAVTEVNPFSRYFKGGDEGLAKNATGPDGNPLPPFAPKTYGTDPTLDAEHDRAMASLPKQTQLFVNGLRNTTSKEIYVLPADAYAKATGDQGGRGVYDEGKGRIYVNVEAMRNNAAGTMGHEYGHLLQASLQPDAQAANLDLVRQQYDTGRSQLPAFKAQYEQLLKRPIESLPIVKKDIADGMSQDDAVKKYLYNEILAENMAASLKGGDVTKLGQPQSIGKRIVGTIGRAAEKIGLQLNSSRTALGLKPSFRVSQAMADEMAEPKAQPPPLPRQATPDNPLTQPSTENNYTGNTEVTDTKNNYLLPIDHGAQTITRRGPDAPSDLDHPAAADDFFDQQARSALPPMTDEEWEKLQNSENPEEDLNHLAPTPSAPTAETDKGPLLSLDEYHQHVADLHDAHADIDRLQNEGGPTPAELPETPPKVEEPPATPIEDHLATRHVTPEDMALTDTESKSAHMMVERGIDPETALASILNDRKSAPTSEQLASTLRNGTKAGPGPSIADRFNGNGKAPRRQKGNALTAPVAAAPAPLPAAEAATQPIGTPVSVAGKNGTITAHDAGKPVVTFDDGTTKKQDLEDLRQPVKKTTLPEPETDWKAVNASKKEYSRAAGPIRDNNDATIMTPGKSYPAKYRVASDQNVELSHEGGKGNPNNTLNERGKQNETPEAAFKAQQQALPQNFQSQSVLSDSPGPEHGPTMTADVVYPVGYERPKGSKRADGTIRPEAEKLTEPQTVVTAIGGNHRGELIKLARPSYEAAAPIHAPGLGIDPQELANDPSHATIYRHLDGTFTPEEAKNLMRELNNTNTRGNTPTEDAISAGHAMSDDTIDMVDKHIAADPDNRTVDKALAEGDTKAIATALQKEGVIRPGQERIYVQSNPKKPRLGMLTPTGAKYVADALMGRVIADPDLVNSITGTQAGNNLARGLGDLIRMQRAGVNIDTVINAARLTDQRIANDEKPKDFDAQSNLLLGDDKGTTGGVSLSPEDKAAFDWFDSLQSRTQFRTAKDADGKIIYDDKGKPVKEPDPSYSKNAFARLRKAAAPLAKGEKDFTGTYKNMADAREAFEGGVQRFMPETGIADEDKAGGYLVRSRDAKFMLNHYRADNVTEDENGTHLTNAHVLDMTYGNAGRGQFVGSHANYRPVGDITLPKENNTSYQPIPATTQRFFPGDPALKPAGDNAAKDNEQFDYDKDGTTPKFLVPWQKGDDPMPWGRQRTVPDMDEPDRMWHLSQPDASGSAKLDAIAKDPRIGPYNTVQLLKGVMANHPGPITEKATGPWNWPEFQTKANAWTPGQIADDYGDSYTQARADFGAMSPILPPTAKANFQRALVQIGQGRLNTSGRLDAAASTIAPGELLAPNGAMPEKVALQAVKDNKPEEMTEHYPQLKDALINHRDDPKAMDYLSRVGTAALGPEALQRFMPDAPSESTDPKLDDHANLNPLLANPNEQHDSSSNINANSLLDKLQALRERQAKPRGPILGLPGSDQSGSGSGTQANTSPTPSQLLQTGGHEPTPFLDTLRSANTGIKPLPTFDPSAPEYKGLSIGTAGAKFASITRVAKEAQDKAVIAAASKAGLILPPETIRAIQAINTNVPRSFEHDAIMDAPNDTIWKVLKSGHTEYGLSPDITSYMDRMHTMNVIAPDFDIKFHGIGIDVAGRGHPMPVHTMTYIHGTRPDLSTINQRLWNAGWNPSEQVYRWTHPSGATIIDAHTGNLLETEDGDLSPIDIDIKLPDGKTIEDIAPHIQNVTNAQKALHLTTRPVPPDAPLPLWSGLKKVVPHEVPPPPLDDTEENKPHTHDVSDHLIEQPNHLLP